MNAITAISLLFLVLYVLKILNYKHRWEHFPELELSGPSSVKITVIIAFRNEVNNLAALLLSLSSQNYPKERYEVILVNDHSEDGSDLLVQKFCDAHANFRLLHNDVAVYGKKSAMGKGVQNALNELIVTTDADCSLDKDWLTALAQVYREKDADMVVGLVNMVSDDSFFGRFQEVEFLSLVAAGAGAAASRHPIYCNGACLAYKKSVFLTLADPMRRNVPSGDDTFFMHELKRNRGNRIFLAKAFPAIATTRGASTFSDFFQQRKRWVSKAPYYRDSDIMYTALLVFLVNFLILYSLILVVTETSIWLFPAMFTVKLLTDLFFLRSFFRFYRKNLPGGWFILYELVYPFYAVFFAVTGIFSGFSWKGRRTGSSFQAPT